MTRSASAVRPPEAPVPSRRARRPQGTRSMPKLEGPQKRDPHQEDLLAAEVTEVIERLRVLARSLQSSLRPSQKKTTSEKGQLRRNAAFGEHPFWAALIFQNRLRRAVDKSGMSKKSIAAFAGISPRALAKLLKGEADPRLSTLERLCAVVGLGLIASSDVVSANRLIQASNEEEPRYPEYRRWLEQRRKDDPSYDATLLLLDII